MSLQRSPHMPMIDLYARADLFPVGTDRQLGEQLTAAVLRAEGVATPGPLHLDNTAAYIHRMDPAAVHTAATDAARTVLVRAITPAAANAPFGDAVPNSPPPPAAGSVHSPHSRHACSGQRATSLAR